MADKIRGITIEIGGDTSGLTKALKGVNTTISSTQKQLRDVEKLLKLDPTNTELLRQKHQLLEKQVGQTKDKLAELNKIQDQMKADGVDKNSEQYMALQREIISTERELKNLEAAARKSNVVLASIGATAQKVADGADKVAQKTRGLSTAAGGALVAIGGMAYKSVTAADDLNTLSQQTGFTTAELQKMQYAADLIDVPMENITSAAAKMTKTLGSSESKFTDLGVATRDSNGELLSTSEIFNNTIQALSKIENETERDEVAMTLFGKSANELAGVIDDGGAALKKFGKEAEDAGLILDQETLDSLNEVNDEIDKLKATLKGKLAKNGAKAVEALAPVFEKVSEAIGKVLEFIGNLDEKQMSLIVTVLAVIAAISPVAGIIGKIAAAISFLAANPIALIIAAIVALAVLIAKNWDTIKATISNIIQTVTETVTGVIETIRSGFEELKTKVGEWIKTHIVEPIKNKINEMKEAGKMLVEGLWNGINDKMAWMKSRIAEWVGNVTAYFKQLLKIGSPSKLFAEYGGYIAQGLAIGIEDGIGYVTKALNGLNANMGVTMESANTKNALANNSAAAGKIVNMTINATTIDESLLDYVTTVVNRRLGEAI